MDPKYDMTFVHTYRKIWVRVCIEKKNLSWVLKFEFELLEKELKKRDKNVYFQHIRDLFMVLALSALVLLILFSIRVYVYLALGAKNTGECKQYKQSLLFTRKKVYVISFWKRYNIWNYHNKFWENLSGKITIY